VQFIFLLNADYALKMRLPPTENAGEKRFAVEYVIH
jgi:hypothetical protein